MSSFLTVHVPPTISPSPRGKLIYIVKKPYKKKRMRTVSVVLWFKYISYLHSSPLVNTEINDNRLRQEPPPPRPSLGTGGGGGRDWLDLLHKWAQSENKLVFKVTVSQDFYGLFLAMTWTQQKVKLKPWPLIFMVFSTDFALSRLRNVVESVLFLYVSSLGTSRTYLL